MAFNNSKSFYINSVKYAALTQWATGAAKTVGQTVRQLAAPSVNNERVFICVVAGTTHATTEPTWNLNRGDSTTDNTVTWLEATGNSALCADITNTPNWTNGSQNQGVSRGHIIKNNAATHLFICTTSGSGHATTEPTWNTTTGATTVDNSVTWTCIGAVSRYGKFECAAARCHVALNLGTNSGGVEPSLFYVGDNHAETQSASAISWPNRGSQGAPIDMICIDTAGNIPPTASADLKETAQVTTTGANVLQTSGTFRVCYGIIFSAGTSANIQLNLNADTLLDKNYEKCTFKFGAGVGSGAQIVFNRGGGKTTLKDCTYKFSNTGQGIVSGGYVKHDNCSIDGAGSIPSIFVQGSTSGSFFEFNGCDLSALSGQTIGNNNSASGCGFFSFNDCKFPASFTPWAFAGSNSQTGEKVTFNRCSSGANPIQHMTVERAGTLQSQKSVYRHASASENAVNYGWQIDTTVNACLGNEYFECPTIAAMNATTGVNRTVTVYGIVNAAALPKNNEIWMDTTYLGSAVHTQGTIKSNRVADFVIASAAHTADTSDWDDGATARANTTAYTVGQVIKLASNPGRLFFCTVAGTSAGSEPGGYASAVDGGAVTDGGATFRAGMRFKMSVTLTSPQVQQSGLIHTAIKLAKASTTYYLDPLVELT